MSIELTFNDNGLSIKVCGVTRTLTEVRAMLNRSKFYRLSIEILARIPDSSAIAAPDFELLTSMSALDSFKK